EHDVAHRVLQSLMHGKCTACGTTDKKAIATLRENAEKGLCPICHTPHELHEHIAEPPNNSLTRQIRDTEKLIDKLASEMLLLEKESYSLAQDFQTITKKTSDTRLQLYEVNLERAELAKQLSTDKD